MEYNGADLRLKVDKKELPKTHLGIYDLEKDQLDTIKNIKSFKMPKDWVGWVAYHKDYADPASIEKKEIPTDSIKASTSTKTKIKIELNFFKRFF